MKTYTKTIFSLIAGSCLFVVGLKIGYEKGALHSLAIDSPARAIISMGSIKMLKENRKDALLNFLENSIDNSILSYGQFKDERNYFLVRYTKLGELLPDSEKYMKAIASYRNEIPISTELHKVNKIIQKTLTEYGWETPHKAPQPMQKPRG